MAVVTLIVMLMMMMVIIMGMPTIMLDCMNFMMMMEEAPKGQVTAIAAATLFDSMIMMVILEIGVMTRCLNPCRQSTRH